MRIRIHPGAASGTAAAPPSKSTAHRMMICAALAPGTSVLHGIGGSEDMLATIDCIRALGAEAERDGDTLTVSGGHPDASGEAVFPCRESGSTLRFFLPISLAAGTGGSFTGTPRLFERGIGIYETIFAGAGIRTERTEAGLRVRGRLAPGTYELPGNVSSQFVTGLLLALTVFGEESRVRVLPPVESRRYIDITISVLARFGIRIEETEPNVFRIPGGQHLAPLTARVEGDWSNAAFLLALNHLGGHVQVTGLNAESLQGDRICAEYLDRLEHPGACLELSGCPDLAPVLMAVAAARYGAVFTGTRRLRIKESDRAAAMREELARMGTRVDVEENRVIVHAGTLHAPGEPLDGHNDHRIVMALAVLCTLTGGEITGAGAVRKSWPEFFGVLETLGVEAEHETSD